MVFCFKLLSQFVFLQLKYYSPPHRWLRKYGHEITSEVFTTTQVA
ncbi:hypothetical protein [uncultured Gammaproteobacteria bacterium]|nr:hypothetical protein [uncultured Gammaproteobacteria bacterium]